MLYISNNFETAKKTLDLFQMAGIVIVLWQNPRPRLEAGIIARRISAHQSTAFFYLVFFGGICAGTFGFARLPCDWSSNPTCPAIFV